MARAIKPGDVVVRVPLSACLSVETALQSTALAPLPEAVRRKLRTDDLLALLLWAEARAGDASPWAPHLAAQPAHVPSALYWTVDEVAKLAGSNLGVLAQRVQAQVQDDYAELVRVLRTHWPDALPTSDKDSHAFTLDQYRRALSLIWVRAPSLCRCCLGSANPHGGAGLACGGCARRSRARWTWRCLAAAHDGACSSHLLKCGRSR